MDEQEQHIADLLKLFYEGRITESGMQELVAWYETFENSPGFAEGITEELRQKIKQEQFALIEARLDHELQSQVKVIRKRSVPIWPRVMIAASLLIFLSVGSYFILRKPSRLQQSAQVKNELQPGINGAVLTLANGQKVVLEKTKVGSITAGVQKSNDSLLVYHDAEVIGYNTLETPKGHQYSVVLPDGSKVWLNAASSLKYPTKFTKERLVELDGEAYFEVVHNPKMPFRVKSGNQITEDIGTSFNINSYKDEPAITTTLLEGAIKVNDRLLTPGQAASLKPEGTIKITEVNTAEAVAWKNGLFSFKDSNTENVMHQLARWYDVEIVYNGAIPKRKFNGDFHRSLKGSQILDILSFYKVHFKIDGKKIIVTE